MSADLSSSQCVQPAGSTQGLVVLNSVRSGLFLILVGATVYGLLVTALCHNVTCEVSETTMLQKRAYRGPRTNRSPNTEELLQHALEQEDAGPPKPLSGHYLKSLDLSSSLQVLHCANGFPPLLICNCLVECAAWRKRSQEKLKEIVGRLFHRLEMADVHVDIDTDAEAEVILKGRQTFGVL